MALSAAFFVCISIYCWLPPSPEPRLTCPFLFTPLNLSHPECLTSPSVLSLPSKLCSASTTRISLNPMQTALWSQSLKSHIKPVWLCGQSPECRDKNHNARASLLPKLTLISKQKFTGSELWQWNVICAIACWFKHICHKQDFLFPTPCLLIPAVMTRAIEALKSRERQQPRQYQYGTFLWQASEMLIDLKLYFLCWAFSSCSSPTAAISHNIISLLHNRWTGIGCICLLYTWKNIFQFCPFFLL